MWFCTIVCIHKSRNCIHCIYIYAVPCLPRVLMYVPQSVFLYVFVTVWFLHLIRDDMPHWLRLLPCPSKLLPCCLYLASWLSSGTTDAVQQQMMVDVEGFRALLFDSRMHSACFLCMQHQCQPPVGHTVEHAHAPPRTEVTLEWHIGFRRPDTRVWNGYNSMWMAKALCFADATLKHKAPKQVPCFYLKPSSQPMCQHVSIYYVWWFLDVAVCHKWGLANWILLES